MHRILNDLDEDLLFELDEVVRNVQLRCSEVTRSGALEDALHEAHPELADLIETEKRVKIDYMMMQTRHFSADRTGSLVTDAFKESYDGPSIKSPRLKGKARVSPGLLPNSPVLNKKKSAGDFMFAMDEDGDDVPPLSLWRESASRNHSRRPSGTLAAQSPVADHEQWYDSRGKKLSSPSQSGSPPLQETPTSSPAVTATSPRIRTVDGSSPWGESPTTVKLGMRDIMAQASSSRASSLSIALSSQTADRPKVEPLASGSFQPKQSQKERKKTQQYQSRPASEPPVTQNLLSSSVTQRVSPWQTVARPKANIKDGARTSSRSASPSSVVIRNTTAPTLTMRQTVAGSNTPGKQGTPGPTQSPQPGFSGHWPSPGATTTSSYFPKASTSTGEPRSASSQISHTTPIQSAPSTATPIQSIRHIPKQQQDPIVGLSMTDILSQQQAEKTAIHDATTAKRSLQEIQQEQEFQEWWDLESRKVKEEEERRTAEATTRSAPSGSRSKARKGRSSANNNATIGGKNGADRNSDMSTPAVSKHGGTSQTGGRSGGRGGRRVRGGPKAEVQPNQPPK